MHARTLHRTTLARRAAKATRAIPAKRRGRAEYSPATDAAMLEVAASVISLTRRYGRGQFSEAQLRDYPTLKEHLEGASTVSRPYPAAADVIKALRASRLPTALILVLTLDICQPVGTDRSLRTAGKKFVASVARRERWTRQGQRMSQGDRLAQLALQACYQSDVAAGRIPIFGKKHPVPQVYARLGLPARMRTYWRKHTNRKAAWDLVIALAARPTTLRGSNRPAFELTALTEFQLANGSPEEKDQAIKRAQHLWDDKYRKGLLRGASFDEEKLRHLSPDAEIPGSDFRDAIDD